MNRFLSTTFTADAILELARTQPAAPAEHRRVYQLAEALFQSVAMKLSVPLYRALAQNRGANLDSFEWPLNNAPWLRQRFAAIRALPDQPARAAALRAIVEWENPGPGGFYDDLGKPHRSPHLVVGPGLDRDPTFLHGPLVTHTRLDLSQHVLRTSWMDSAGTLNELPLSLRYTGLDPAVSYEVSFVYANPDNQKWRARLVAGERIELLPLASPPAVVGTLLTARIPREAVRDGTLTLTWHRTFDAIGSGSGFVAEVWLRRVGP